MKFLRRPHIDNFGEKLRRSAWLFMAILFVFTGVVASVIIVWQQIHQTPSNPSTQPANTTACSFNGAQTAAILPAPSVYKTETKPAQLITSDLSVGTGPAVKAGDCVLVKYYGTLAASGKEFDEDFSQPLALQFLVGQGEVIPGWDQGIPGMKAGGIRRLIIPAALAYGNHAQGSIPANSNLVFVVKLLSIK